MFDGTVLEIKDYALNLNVQIKDWVWFLVMWPFWKPTFVEVWETGYYGDAPLLVSVSAMLKVWFNLTVNMDMDNRPAKWSLVINYCLLIWNPLKHNPSLKSTIQRGKHSLDGKNWSVCRLAHFCFSGILGLTWWRLRDGREIADLTISSSVSGSRLQLQSSWSAP